MLFSYPLWVRSFVIHHVVLDQHPSRYSGFFALSSTVLFPRPIFWLLVTRIIHLFVFTQSAGFSCARSPASLLASASVSPRERRTYTVFAVWCLGSSRTCGGSTSCSPVHVLTHVFSSVRFLHMLCVVSRTWFFAAWSWSPPCSVLCGCSVRRREHLVAGASASKVCTLHLSSGFALLDFPRSCTGLLWFFEFTSPSESGDQSEYGCDRGLAFPASASGLQSRRSSVRLSAAVAAAFGYVPRGQRALLDADMLELIDRSTCLVEPVTVGVLCSSRACAVPAASTSSAASGRCSRLYPTARPCGRSFAPSCSIRAAPVASLQLFVHPCSARLQLHGLGVTACTWVTACFLRSVVHLTSWPYTERTSPCYSSSDTVSFFILFALQRDVSPCSST